MKIAMVSHYFESHRGGVEIVTGQLGRAFTKLGHSVAWLASDSSPPFVGSSICTRAVSIRANNSLERCTGIPYPIPLPCQFQQLRAEVDKADIVIIHDAFYLLCREAQRLARRAGKPVLIIQHIGFVPYRNPLLRLGMTMLDLVLTKRALSAAEQVVFISQLTRAHFSHVRFRREPIVVFNGVDTDAFAPLPSHTDRTSLRLSLGLDPARPTVLFVGRFVEKKGLAHIERMAKLRPGWDWVIAGWGPIDPASWNLPNVQVLTGRSGETLAVLYQAADVLVLPSVGEGFPLVIQEALASGLPVVCGCDTATADSAAEVFLCGAVVQPGNPGATANAFLEALEATLSLPDLNGVERQARATFARERYSWDRTATVLVDVILSLTSPMKVSA